MGLRMLPLPTQIATNEAEPEVTVPRSRRAYLSLSLDFACCAAILVLLVAWMSDVNAGTTMLSAQFMATGFCNSHNMPTQTLCYIFDYLGGLVFLGMMRYRENKACIPLACYLFSHGFGHQAVAQQWPMATAVYIHGFTVVVLASLLYLGPMKLMEGLIQHGVAAPKALGMSLVMEALVVAAFFVFIKKSYYVLLYLNVTISLCIHVPRVVLLGASSAGDVSKRVDLTLFFGKMFTNASVTTMVLAEPFLCEMGVATAGGHLLFDIALFLNSFVDVLNKPPRTAAGATGGTVPKQYEYMRIQ